jgi:hypothetical protein
MHRVAHQGLHLLQFAGGGGTVAIADHRAPDLRRAHIARKIDSHALLFEARKEFPKGVPGRVDLIVFVAGAVGFAKGVGEWRGGTAFSRDFGGDALVDLRRQMRVHQDGSFRLSEHIDEAGRDGKTGGIDSLFGSRGIQMADGGDMAVANRNVGGVPRGACAVDDVAVADEDVVRLAEGG